MDDRFGSFFPLLSPPTQNPQPASVAEIEIKEDAYPDIEGDDLHRSSPYTDGETRMVMVKDGERDCHHCWAMLLSQEMVDHVNLAKQQSRTIEKRGSAVDEAATEVLIIEASIEEAEDSLNRVEGPETKQLRVGFDTLQVKLCQAKDRRDMLQEDMDSTSRVSDARKVPPKGWLRMRWKKQGCLTHQKPTLRRGPHMKSWERWRNMIKFQSIRMMMRALQ